ncbi:twitching motility protein PilT [Gluconobacter sp. LMG 1744]|nr:twitching motility protein PilT [Gluconobacter cadivus]
MKVLLDTHALLWWLSDSEKLGPTSREIIADGGIEELFVDAIV